jgi:hypothetical protein
VDTNYSGVFLEMRDQVETVRVRAAADMSKLHRLARHRIGPVSIDDPTQAAMGSTEILGAIRGCRRAGTAARLKRRAQALQHGGQSVPCGRR